MKDTVVILCVYNMCVCVSVIALAGTFLVYTLKTIKMLLGSLWHFQDLYYVAFIENVLFKCTGIVS